jgi:hypothetical protein
MSMLLRCNFATLLMAAPLLVLAPAVRSADTGNLTGLPAYPNLTSAVMDGTFKTDTLGHWCMRFWADTADSLTTVEAWYRKALIGSSEIDLTHDKAYKNYSGLVGVKIVLGIDYVVVYKTSSQAPTSIDLYRCSPLR